jgi:hypothetical protein
MTSTAAAAGPGQSGGRRVHDCRERTLDPVGDQLGADVIRRLVPLSARCCSVLGAGIQRRNTAEAGRPAWA